MEKLKQNLDRLIACLPDEKEFRSKLETLYSVYRFNDFEYMIATLLGKDILSFDDYLEMRDSYVERNAFLYIFEIGGPRTFGEAWAQAHLKELVPELSKPSKKLDPKYSGEYDLYLDRKIRIEVKASRAVDASSDEPLYVKALSSDSQKEFWMNFQQVKCACCDVFVWIAVWRDKIRYWYCHPTSLNTILTTRRGSIVETWAKVSCTCGKTTSRISSHTERHQMAWRRRFEPHTKES